MGAYLKMVIPGIILMWIFVRAACDEMNPLLFLIILSPAIIMLPALVCDIEIKREQKEEKRKAENNQMMKEGEN